MTVTKDTLLKKADALLGEARRVRKVSTTVGAESERLSRQIDAGTLSRITKSR